MLKVISEKDLLKKLEIIYSIVGVDEDGYLADNYPECDTHEVGGEFVLTLYHESILFKFIAEKYAEKLLKQKITILEINLTHCETKSERLSFLKAIEEDVDIKINSNEIIKQAFKQTRLKEDIKYDIPFMYNRKLIFTETKFKGEGIAYCKYLHYIITLIEKENESNKVQNIDEDDDNFEPTTSTNIPSLKKINQKIILLKELGVINNLKKIGLNKTNSAKLLGCVLGIDDAQGIETIRKALSRIELPENNPESLETDSAVNAINRELNKIDLSTDRLKDIFTDL
jgi:hypothetical protein